MTIDVPQREIDRLRAVLDKIEKELKKSSGDILRQAMTFAVKSAAIATAPGRTSKPSKLPTKYTYRPIVRYQSNPPTYATDAGFTFTSEKRPRSKNVRQITRAWQYWNKRKAKGETLQKPYLGSASGKYDKDDKFGKIPHRGAGKACWLKALGLIHGSGESYSDKESGKAMPRVSENKGLTEHGITVENIIRYISITSPNAATEATTKATNKLIGSYKKKIADLDKYKA